MSNSKSEIIPYVIMVCYPGSCHIHHIFSSIKKSKLNDNLLEQFVDFMYDVIDTSKLNSVKDIEKLRNNNNYNNAMWTVMSFINNEWVYTTPTDDLLFEGLIKERARRYIDYISSTSSDDTFEQKEEEEEELEDIESILM
jgi:hypothetical protein